jgi:hypothetical protein
MRAFRLSLATVLTWVVVVALALALLAQHQLAERQDRALKARLGQALIDKYAQEGMDRILTDQGTDVLKHCLSVELLQTSENTVTSTGFEQIRGTQTTVTSTGIVLEQDVALRAACVLLDHRSFGWLNALDDPIPQVGLRIRDGHSSLDMLISLDDGSHQDIWIEIHDEGGKQVHRSGPVCMHDPTLQKLGEELLRLLSR